MVTAALGSCGAPAGFRLLVVAGVQIGTQFVPGYLAVRGALDINDPLSRRPHPAGNGLGTDRKLAGQLRNAAGSFDRSIKGAISHARMVGNAYPPRQAIPTMPT